MYEPSVGEVVRIRQWDDMKADPDFEMSDTGHLDCIDGICFNTEMKELCGRTFTVENVEEGFVEPVERGRFGRWIFTTYMIEPASIIEFQPEEFLAVLGG